MKTLSNNALLISVIIAIVLIAIIGCGIVQLREPTADFLHETIGFEAGQLVAKFCPAAVSKIRPLAESLSNDEINMNNCESLKNAILDNVKDQANQVRLKRFLGLVEIKESAISDGQKQMIQASMKGFLEGLDLESD